LLAGNTSSRTQNGGIGHIYQLTPTLINEFRIGVNARPLRYAAGLRTEPVGTIRIPGVNRSPETSGLANINVAGLFGVGGSILTPLQVASTDVNFSESSPG